MTYCFFEDLFKLDPVQLMLLLDIHEFIRDFVNLSIPRNSKILSTTLVKSWCCSWKLALILAVNLLKFHSSTVLHLYGMKIGHYGNVNICNPYPQNWKGQKATTIWLQLNQYQLMEGLKRIRKNYGKFHILRGGVREGHFLISNFFG